MMRDTAVTAAKAGGSVVRKYFGQALSFERKADRTVVSRADKESEATIISIIRDAFPDHAINGEETGASGDSEYVWHIDPLDGTTNFMHGIPLCAVSLGLARAGRFILGVIYDPFRDELYVAEEGKGVTCNGRPIRTAAVNGLTPEAKGIVVIDASFRGAGARKMRVLQACLDLGLKPQVIGSIALQFCEVARGQVVASLSDTMHVWDYAAGVALVREAGGIVTDQYGDAPTTDASCILASCSKEVHERLLPIVRKEYDGYPGRG